MTAPLRVGPLSVDLSLPLGDFELRLAFSTSAHVTGIFGPSGSGKTSLLESVAGLRPHARGCVAMGEAQWQNSAIGINVPPEQRRIGYVPQDSLLFPHLNVSRNLGAGARRARRIGVDVARTMRSVVELLELGPLLNRRVDTLSGGERKRVALGRALCSDPRLLILDEPLAGLDATLRRKVLPFLRRVRAHVALPMLLVSHDPAVVQALCDDVIALRRGSLVGRGSPRAIVTSADAMVESRNPSFAAQFDTDFENVVPCRLVDTRGSTSVVRIGPDEGGVDIVTSRIEGDLGGRHLLGIPVRALLLATTEPRDISAANVLRAEISAIRRELQPALVMLSLAPGVEPLAAAVTAASCNRLGLAPGRLVFAVLKATECIVYGEEPE